LKKHTLQVQGGLALLPEARPKVTDSNTAWGMEASIRYAVSDYYTLQFKGWKDISDKSDLDRGGLSYTNIVSLSNAEDRYKFGLIPILAFVFDETGLEGGGFAIPVCVWFPRTENTGIYFAAGPGVGIHAVGDGEDDWGWGLEFTWGMALDFLERMSLNIELDIIAQTNSWDEEMEVILSPGLNLGVTF
jgi:hypothetical protein